MQETASLNEALESALRAAHQEVQGTRRPIRLPSSCQFSGSTKKVRLTLSPNAVAGNMQDNAAAFEAWLLALKGWNCIEAAELAWEPPAIIHNGHYQRFLYRVLAFKRLFDWFTVDQSSVLFLADSKVENARPGSLCINTAVGTPKDQPSAASAESLLEKYLVDSGWLASTFGLHHENVGRQFPVGLFEGKIAGDCRVFTGGKSAIDLVGLDEKHKRLWIFELKAQGNLSMGIVSELLFYVSVMAELVQNRFRFDDIQAPRIKGRLHHQAIASTGVAELVGCFLAPDFHPLLDDDRVVRLLNSGAWPDAVKVSFCQQQLPSTLVESVKALSKEEGVL